MPYLKPARRKELASLTEHIVETKLTCAGDLNYLFTILAQTYLQQNGINYQKYNDLVGALEGAKLELYRRSIAPYENLKIQENGDVDIDNL